MRAVDGLGFPTAVRRDDRRRRLNTGSPREAVRFQRALTVAYADGDQTLDVDGLDRDGDGIACES
jgi:hypothetical protein